MSEDLIEYPKLVENAMRSVVRNALLHVAETGLPGQHHFYITFRTQDDGVSIADSIAAQYPEEMTVVLEHQFWDLEITDEYFAVTLSFGGRRERLVIPFAAMTSFVDPSVKFGLQFGGEEGSQDGGENGERPQDFADGEDTLREQQDDAPPDSRAAETDIPEDDTGTVVALDSFRKK